MHVFGTMSICTVYSEFKQVIKISFMVNIVRYPHGPLTNVTITLFRIQKNNNATHALFDPINKFIFNIENRRKNNYDTPYLF